MEATVLHSNNCITSSVTKKKLKGKRLPFIWSLPTNTTRQCLS